MIAQMLMTIVFFSDPNSLVLSSMGKQPVIIENEATMLKDPNDLKSLFVEYKAEYNKPYLVLLTQNWGGDNWNWTPLDWKGVIYCPWKMPYSWSGDLDMSGRIEMQDFAIYAKHYRGGIKIPVPSIPIPAPLLTPIEIKAALLRILLDATEETTNITND